MPIESNLLDDGGRPRWLAAAVVVGALLVLSLVLGFAVAVADFSAGAGDTAAANVTSVETSEAHCGTHLRQSGSEAQRTAGGTTYLSLNGTLPVAAVDSEVTATVDEIGEHRYRLDLRRSPGNRTEDCYLERRYNVTVALPDTREFTVLVTHDGFLREMTYRTRWGGGGWSTSAVARPPSMNESAWARALNASEAYARNRSDGA
ncbi:hypothetical protein ACOZ4N_06845 [Halorientalis pallida]|uniref:hypothetical protein n=1 Tax=Halorientalis pallida TaxID=2479928 RepID=UPI003C6F9E06